MARQKPLFRRVAIVGFGLIGSSVARVLRRDGLAGEIVACDASAEARARVLALGIADRALASPAAAVRGADLVMLCTPVRSFGAIGAAMARGLSKGAIVSDVGSVKGAVVEALAPHIPRGVHLVPGHPIAGTENSGPDAGFAELFQGRWCVLTPPEGTSARAVGRVAEFWRRAGMEIATMSPAHHDRVLAITSHVPHLIAYTIVSTVSDLEETMRAEVIKFAASGFRDFTRVAGSDPTMWRDIFLSNREAVLEMTGRLYEDIALLQKAIRHGDGDTLHRVFSRSRRVRRGIVQAKQA
ncbi:MAG: prephenate/arogenate dehydrogenase family protein [Alphaproteobacteria bacterium]|jgi:cyclohexadieny/prephenate dehydrogenase